MVCFIQGIYAVHGEVGGWYPVFFTQYQSTAVSRIIHDINHHTVRKIEIQYDQNQQLATHIQAEIQRLTSITIPMQHIILKDTPTMQFQHDKVTVLIWSVSINATK